ncbi:hypothetical protein DU19_0130 [Chlamydia muridarum]|nr:hypothetical protein DU18_0131 [Chlamydia muridarum]KDU82454.1 hypothetical protein DU19_0130 [Chlamydia muridarum]
MFSFLEERICKQSLCDLTERGGDLLCFLFRIISKTLLTIFITTKWLIYRKKIHSEQYLQCCSERMKTRRTLCRGKGYLIGTLGISRWGARIATRKISFQNHPG